MSKASWRKKFYPIAADSDELNTNLKRTQHSLQKWRGLRADVLAEHKLRVDDEVALRTTRDGIYVMRINGESCALCHYHSSVFIYGCPSCPISRARGGYACDMAKPKELENEAPWHAWTYDKNPEPMIEVLEKAERALIEEANRRKR